MTPKHLKICGRKCPLKIKVLEDGDEGHYIPETRELAISSEVPASQVIPLSVHEGFHAIIDLTGLGQDMPIEVEHVIITNLLTFLEDNYEVKFKERKPRLRNLNSRNE